MTSHNEAQDGITLELKNNVKATLYTGLNLEKRHIDMIGEAIDLKHEAQKTNEEIINAFRNLYVTIEETMERSVLDKYEMFLQGVLTLKDTQHATKKADWLRSEIEKLEGIEYESEDSPISPHESQRLYDIEYGFRMARASIITRYKEELKVLKSK